MQLIKMKITTDVHTYDFSDGACIVEDGYGHTWLVAKLGDDRLSIQLTREETAMFTELLTRPAVPPRIEMNLLKGESDNA